jgi:hypothetical protein
MSNENFMASNRFLIELEKQRQDVSISPRAITVSVTSR